VREHLVEHPKHHLDRWLTSRDAVITWVSIAAFILCALFVDRFLTLNNLFNLSRQIALIGIVSVGMTFLLVAGEIDISVGSVYGVLNVVMGILVVRHSFNPWFGMVLVITIGLVIGAFNGIVVTQVRVPSFIVTLAAMTAYRSAALLLSGERPSVTEGIGSFYAVTGGYLGRIPCLVIWMAAAMLLGGGMLSQTQWGWHAYSAGGNEEAARECGIRTVRVKIICFMLTSALCGLIAALLFGWLHVATPTTGTGFEFQVIAAVVVGGVALNGGRGSVYGAFIGAMILGIIGSALVLLNLSQQWEEVVTGALILVVGAVDVGFSGLFSRELSHLRHYLSSRADS
jgi:ribose/xylose/arabinose/galactoside ABC-type transport system permease subunit